MSFILQVGLRATSLFWVSKIAIKFHLPALLSLGDIINSTAVQNPNQKFRKNGLQTKTCVFTEHHKTILYNASRLVNKCNAFLHLQYECVFVYSE